MRAQVKSIGYVVDCVEDAGAALASIRGATPRLVLLDLSIEGVEELCATLRACAPPPMIILVSARSDQELAAEAARLGASSFVSKGEGLGGIAKRVLAALTGTSAVAASTTAPESLPHTRFRTAALEGLERIEVAWDALIHGVETEVASANLHRDLHTIKGDSRLLGFASISSICDRLEGLMALASKLNYEVPIELDLIVGMTIGLLDMLLRDGAPSVGMDVAGFVAQLGELVEAGASDVHARSATQATHEHLSSLLAQTLVRLQPKESVALRSLLEWRATALSEFASDAGKPLEVMLEVDELSVPESVGSTLELAVTHLLRNSLAHGIEAPEVRARMGKPEVGTVWIRAARDGERVQVEIIDDGGGVDTQTVKARALERGLLSEAEAEAVSEVELLALLFRPGFSTRERADDLAGRGIGLDAVKAAVEGAGGSIRVSSKAGQGASVVVSIPLGRDA